MLMIRLARFGAKKKPFYRIVVIEKERARNGRSVEVVGHYNPTANPAQVLLKQYGQAKKMMKSLSGNMGSLGKGLAKSGMLKKLGLPGF